ncbi:glycosyltransferase family 4 protein [Oceanibaculum pacificum]|uniref:Glycosyl transferase family 1 n=1 Tax=Oceanibaculum pacificum TaxID=580166 RepID=A0A154VZ21_9PROT|nr:glycosyltransferase family 4 protein [Oceanibaculum pacificum]KZD06451.1 glycosyl transferase family 1 [Oceanibaculum pacificum]
MRILFIHQNCPGQYKHLVQHLRQDPKNEIVFISKPNGNNVQGIRRIDYQLHRQVNPKTHHYLSSAENGVLHGQAVARVLMKLRDQGWRPDVICAHPGWGEALFVKDVYPDVPLLGFFEFFYRATGADCDFDPEYPNSMDDHFRLRVKNTVNLLSLDACDWGMSPTFWQRSVHPDVYKDRISVVHDGVDTDLLVPRADARIVLPNGVSLTGKDEVVTYVSRNLEPYRGFHIYMKALEEMCRRRPNAHFLVVGGDDVSYGRRLPDGKMYREELMKTVTLDKDRVHFVGRVPYDGFMKILQVSQAHIYLTYPFVLSWSMMEAMSAGCLVIGSATTPVQEVIEDGVNGLLADFFSPSDIADKVDAVFDHPDRMAALRVAARQTIIDRYDLKRICLPAQLGLIDTLIKGGKPAIDLRLGV